MARLLRIEQPGGWYHVSARGNERKAIYRDNRDRRHFLELIAEMVARFRVWLHGFECAISESKGHISTFDN
jgi:REP element-mobilizing transposase RayT